MSAEEQLTLGLADVGPSDPLAFGDVSLEQGLAAIEALRAWYTPRDRNEATTRRQLLDRLLHQCLGWHEDDATFEDRVVSTNTYTDYTFALPRPVFIVEAKRESRYFDVPAGQARRVVLRTLCRANPHLSDAVEQVRQYCLQKGVQFAAVSNGHQFVIFAAVRTDGIDPLDGRAVVFRSLDEMVADFTTLWNLISRSAMLEGRLQRVLLGGEVPRIPPKLIAQIPDYPGTKGRNTFQAELRAVSEIVLEDITNSREVEPRFLRECYCENGALEQHSLETRDILRARYAQLFNAAEPGPALTQMDSGVFTKDVANIVANRPVLLIGDVGVGKTTFVKHLLVTEDEDIVKNAIILYIDLGASQAITPDFRASLLQDIQYQLLDNYNIDIEENEFVRAVYRADLGRLQRSIYKNIRERDPAAYENRELHFLEQRLAFLDRHVKAALEHVVTSWRRQVIIILDNCDQRTADVQEQAFVMAEEMAQKWPALVFLALRPETFHASRRRGALTGYHPRAFSISPPRVDDVIRRRLEFGLRIVRGEIPVETGTGSSFVGRFESLEALMRIFLRSLRTNVQLVECIENVSGGNVRLALNLIRNFFGSGHANTAKMVRIEEQNGEYTVPLHEFVRAIIYGDRVYYDPAESPVTNLFDVSSSDRREHFLLANLLAGLSRLMDPKVEKGFVASSRIYEGLQGAGFLPEQIDGAISRAVRGKLVETVARRIPDPGAAAAPSLRITSVGLYHVIRLARQFTYVDAVIPDTPIFESSFRSRLTAAEEIDARLHRAQAFSEYLDHVWVGSATPFPWFDWEATKRDLQFDIRRVQARRVAAQHGPAV